MSESLKEKMYEWTPDKIRWYQDACNYSKNNRNQLLAEYILKDLRAQSTICDLGCGIGALSLSLAEHGAYQVMAVDQNKQALAYLKQTLQEKAIKNVTVIEGDYRTLAFETLPDITVLCMAGNLKAHLEQILRITAKAFYFITDDVRYHHFKSGKLKKDYESTEAIKELLEKEHLDYEEERIITRLGQPFRSMADAILFMQNYNREASLGEIKLHLEACLEKTEDQVFTYYYPCEKIYRIFKISV